MNYLKGHKPVELNKGDLKNLEKFSDLEEKYSNITDDLTAMLGDKEFEGSIFALRNKKEKKYKSIYIFKPEKDKDGNDILRFYKSVSTDDVSSEAVKEFEDIIMESLKETVSLDEKWSQIIWNDNVIEPRMIRLASINLSAGLFGMIFGILLYVITLTSGAIVSKIGEKKEEEKKETGMLPAENKSLEVQPEKGIEVKEETAVVNPEAEKSVVIKEENEDNND